MTQVRVLDWQMTLMSNVLFEMKARLTKDPCSQALIEKHSLRNYVIHLKDARKSLQDEALNLRQGNCPGRYKCLARD